MLVILIHCGNNSFPGSGWHQAVIQIQHANNIPAIQKQPSLIVMIIQRIL
jgi:hypothetical protein